MAGFPTQNGRNKKQPLAAVLAGIPSFMPRPADRSPWIWRAEKIGAAADQGVIIRQISSSLTERSDAILSSKVLKAGVHPH